MNTLAPMPPTSKWTAYWNQSKVWPSPRIYELNAQLFYDGIQKEIPLNSTHRILNIGCGPGYLERLLSPQIESMTGVDPSFNMIQAAQENCKELTNVQFTRSSSGNFNYAFLRPKKFHYFFCISVAQYFNHHQDLIELINNLRERAVLGAKLILADLPQSTSPLHCMLEIGRSFIQSFQKRYTYTLLREGVMHTPQYLTYQRQLRKCGQQVWTPAIFSDLFLGKSITWRPLTQILSICPTRLNVIIDL